MNRILPHIAIWCVCVCVLHISLVLDKTVRVNGPYGCAAHEGSHKGSINSIFSKKYYVYAVYNL